MISLDRLYYSQMFLEKDENYEENYKNVEKIDELLSNNLINFSFTNITNFYIKLK